MGAERVLRMPVQARAQKTRAALLRAAEQEFSERGYAQTTAKSITDRAGVATGSFYQYFQDKDDALRELAQTRVAELADRVASFPFTAPCERIEDLVALARQSIRRVVAEVVQYHRRDAGLHAVLTERRHADPALDTITQASERNFVAYIEAGLAQWGYRGDRKTLAFVIFGMIEGSVHSHVLGAKMVSDRRLLDTLSDSIVALVRAGVPHPWVG